MSTYNEALQKIADEYLAAVDGGMATAKEIAVWAVANKRWEPPPDLVIRQCREDISRALREQYLTESTGGSVRAKHAARITKGLEQQTFWVDIRQAKRPFMEIAFQQRREQIVGDCRQLDRDVTFYNKSHPEEKSIQICFNFMDDVEEGRFPGDFSGA